MSKRKIISISIGIILLLLIATLCWIFLRKPKSKSLWEIPLNNPGIVWGMTSSEMEALLGKPDEEISDDLSKTLTYKNFPTKDFGSANVVFTFGEGQKLESNEYFMGLAVVEIQTTNIKQKKIYKTLKSFYGDLIVNKSGSGLESLQTTIPNYYKEQLFNKDWQMQQLPADQQNTINNYNQFMDKSYSDNMPYFYIALEGVDALWGNVHIVGTNLNLISK